MDSISKFVQGKVGAMQVSKTAKKETWHSMVWKFMQKVNPQLEFDGFPVWDIVRYRSCLRGLSVEDLLGWWQDCEKSPNFSVRFHQLWRLRKQTRPRKLKQVKLKF